MLRPSCVGKVVEPPRRPERYAVTIIAGFKCKDGIVICADTQETVQHSKRNVTKVRFEPTGPYAQSRASLGGTDIAAAFCGAGDGPFIDKIVDKAWGAAKSARSLDEACELIEVEIKNTYQEYGSIFQPGYCPSVELIYGVKMSGNSRLFTAIGPIVNEKEGYDSGGSGHYMADFISKRLHNYGLTIRQCVILAAYVLAQAKEHVEGCGGESHIAVLRESDKSGLVDSSRISATTELLENADKTLGKIMIDAADLYEDSEKFLNECKQQMELLSSLRDYKREDIEDWEKRFGQLFRTENLKRDSLGFFVTDKPETNDERCEDATEETP